MERSKNILQSLTYLMILLLLTGYLLLIGRPLLLPIAFAVLFALLLRPLAAFIERFIRQRHAAILISFLAALLPVLGATWLFGVQLISIIRDLPALSRRVTEGLAEAIHWLEQTTQVSMAEGRQWVLDNFSTIVEAPLQFLAGSVSSSTTLLASVLFSVLITFFLLLYRSSFKNFILVQFRPSERDNASEVLDDIQSVVQKYLYGMLLVILILGVLNSTGLWLIGIRYPFFWGFLAAFLAIIPYIGTTLGGTFPFLYALATAGTLWQPAAVVLLYVTVQNIEGNFITPKVVGGSVNINPLVAILSLFFWGLLWGIAGLVLALPIVAVIKVGLSYTDALRPVSVLLSDGLYNKRDEFLERYDGERFRLGSLFR